MAYNVTMDFEWDPSKSDACYAERGFDFAYVVQAFLDPKRMVSKDQRWEYGEDRFQLTGAIETRLFVVVYTMRKASTRIISARKANQREVKRYEDSARAI